MHNFVICQRTRTASSSHIDSTGTIEGAPHLKPEHLAVFDCSFRPLRQGGGRGILGGSSRARYGLIVSNVALAVVLPAGAGLLIWSYLYLQGDD